MWKLLTPLLILLVSPAYANDVNGDFSNNYQDSTIDSNNDTTNNTTNNNGTGAGSPAPVMSSIAPTVMGGGGNDSCLLPTSTGIQVTMFGVSSGTMEQDDYCNRRKNARLLGAPQQVGGLGLQISGISILCGSPDGAVFKSMLLANTPCPIVDIITGKILMGKNAVNKYRENPEVFIVGYADDKLFWDTILRIGEDITDEQNKAKVTNNSNSLSLSEQFRSTRRDRRTETTSTSR